MIDTRTIKFLMPFCLIAVAIVVVAIVFSTKPNADRKRPQAQTNISVSVVTVSPESFTPTIRSYGTVEARTQSKLVAQVSGRVEFVTDKFRDGGHFKSGDLLMRIEQADYKIELAIAEANLLDAERRLEEERARVRQAEEDWRRLGKSGEPAALVLRRPQLKAAEASMKAAEAQLDRAQLNLNRTEIRASFAGRVVQTFVDLGQVVSMNTQLADVYATDMAEVRLPIKNQDLSRISLPEDSSDTSLSAKIISELSGKTIWQAKIVRSAATVDDTTRQLYLVAEIKSPFTTTNTSASVNVNQPKPALKVGQYVTAEISAKPLINALIVPNSAIYQGSYVYVYRDERVYREEIVIGWQDAHRSVITRGVDAGDRVVISPLGKVASGTRVLLVGDNQPDMQKRQTAGEQNK